MSKLRFVLVLVLLSQAVTLADDRTLHVSIHGLFGSPPTSAIVGVTSGSISNQNPATISFYVEYSDDLLNWRPLTSFAFGNTNSDATIATNLTNGQMALFFDENASARRFYRAVEAQ
jgi:hypothetical protein